MENPLTYETRYGTKLYKFSELSTETMEVQKPSTFTYLPLLNTLCFRNILEN